jgi:hypothetical protein
MSGFADPRGYSAHGMDVVSSSTHPGELWVYLVNQRPKSREGTGAGLGTDPSVEVFRMRSVEAEEMEHVATVDSPLMQSPNDVVGSADGTHFWFTNDGSHLTGFAVRLSTRGMCHYIPLKTNLVTCGALLTASFHIRRLLSYRTGMQDRRGRITRRKRNC